MTRFHPPGGLNVAHLVAATGGRLRGGAPAGEWTLCTDTRELRDGALFVALRGENHDGHDWVEQAITGHYVGACIEPDSVPLSVQARCRGPLIEVADTLVAFGDAARAHLRSIRPSVVAVTGSVGKTTTRAMLASILAQMAPGLATEGNFNNRIGLPLTLLSLTPEHRWAALELGMSEPGEIRELARLCEPRVRVITQVAPVHLEFFDGVEGIADAKGELFESARPGDVLVYPADNPLSARFPRPAGAIEASVSLTPGVGASHPLSIEDRGLDGTAARVQVWDLQLDVVVPIPGAHQLLNALSAATAARALGASAEHIVAGLAAVQVPGRRMKIEQRGGVHVVDDAYNASPASIEAVLRSFATFADGRRVAALGDMLELGPTAPALHAAVGSLAAELGLDLLVGTGPLMAHAVDAAKAGGIDAVAVADSDAAGALLKNRLRADDWLLVKGSRGMRMERVIDSIGPHGQDAG